MKKRILIKTAGTLFVLLAFAMEGMLIGRAQGSVPVSIITLGNVSAILTEPGSMEPESRFDQAIVIEKPKAGQTIRREPTVCMAAESGQAYLRAKILVSNLTEQQADALLSGLEQSPEWNLNRKDGYYYYKNLVFPKQRVPVFKGIHIPKQWKNADRLRIDVTVEVAEASRLTPVMDAECHMTGWIPAE